MTHLLPGEWIIPSIIQTHQSQRPESFCTIERPFQDLRVAININCGIKHSLLIHKCHGCQKVVAEQCRDQYHYWNCWSKKNRLGFPTTHGKIIGGGGGHWDDMVQKKATWQVDRKWVGQETELISVTEFSAWGCLEMFTDDCNADYVTGSGAFVNLWGSSNFMFVLFWNLIRECSGEWQETIRERISGKRSGCDAGQS